MLALTAQVKIPTITTTITHPPTLLRSQEALGKEVPNRKMLRGLPLPLAPALRPWVLVNLPVGDLVWALRVGPGRSPPAAAAAEGGSGATVL